MSLPKENLQDSIFDAKFLTQDLIEEGSPYRLFRREILPSLRELRPELAKLYCLDNGRPAIEPVVMAGTTLLQFMEGAPDRKAAESVRLHLGWKHALDLELDDPGFHAASLVTFRRRLLEGEQERAVFDAVLERLRERGLVKKNSKQRIDSTHIVGCVAEMSRLEAVRETMRLCLQDLEGQDLGELPGNWTSLQERYCESQVEYRKLTQPAKMRRKLRQAGRDVLGLLEWIQGQPGLAGRERCRLLERLADEQFELVEGELQARRVEMAGALKNPHDPEAQWSAKDPLRKTAWVGFKAQITETVAEEQEAGKVQGRPTAQFITGVTTTEAATGDMKGMELALESQAEQGLDSPPELFADAAYISANVLDQARREGREMVGPAKPSPRRKNVIPVEEFDVDIANRKAVCPNGRTNRGCSLTYDRFHDVSYYRFKWGSHCRSCPLQPSCTGRRAERVLQVGIHHDLLQQRRREQQTEAFQKRMRRRNAIEGTISELVRGYGLRRTRYRGTVKTALANHFIGAACNVRRWARLVSWQLAQAS